MAKKQQPKLSYAPNMGLIAGEAQVAASEAGLSNVGQSFVTGAASVFGAIKQANAERDARMEAYESEISGLVNTNQFEDPKNKQVIKGFLNTQRDEYIKLSKIYDKTKDREVKDKMEEIKFSLVNLNDQIKVFNQDKLDYRTASDENQLASLKTYDRTGDDFFTTAFTNNAAFSIDEMGDINFGINNNSYKYKDKAGKWQSKNNIDESNLLKIYSQSYSDGGKGNAFNSGNVRRGLYNSFKNTGNSALQVFVTTDLTSDESSLSFEEQFASGKLSKEMYAGFTAKEDGTYDTDWMFENKNGDVLRNKVSDYFTKVVEDGHGQGRADNYKSPPVDTDTDTEEFTLLRSNKSSQVTGKGGGYTPNSALNYIGKSANDRSIIDLGDDKFIWDNDKKAYTLNGETINNKYSLFSTIYGEDFDAAEIIGMYNGIEDWQGETRKEETFDTKTNLDVNFVNKADETVAADLNNLLPPPGDTRNPNAYIFKPLAAFENLTGIYKEGGKIERFPKVYPEGHPKAGEKHPKAGRQAHFKTKGKTTGSNAENLAEMIDLLQTFGLYEYIPKQLP